MTSIFEDLHSKHKYFCQLTSQIVSWIDMWKEEPRTLTKSFPTLHIVWGLCSFTFPTGSDGCPHSCLPHYWASSIPLRPTPWPPTEIRSQSGLEVASCFTLTEMLRFYIKILFCFFYFCLRRQRKGILLCLSQWLTEMKCEREQLCLWAREVKTRQDLHHIFLTTQ